jgi:hypothetical protein
MSKTVAIGILHGREETFPAAVIHEINEREGSVRAESIVLGGLFPTTEADYTVVLDRISHLVPFYRSYLRQQARIGAHVLPEPVPLQALDRIIVSQVALELDIPALPMVALPTKNHPPGVTGEDLNNLVYPLPWDSILERVGFPAVFRPVRLQNNARVAVSSLRQLWDAYALTADRQVVLQSFRPADERVMVLVIGEQTLVLSYDPGHVESAVVLAESSPTTYRERAKYLLSATVAPELQASVKAMSGALLSRCQLTMAGVEWSIVDGQPRLVDLHCCPDLDWWSLGETNFTWAVKACSDYIATLAGQKVSPPSSPARKSKKSASGTAIVPVAHTGR